MNYLYFDKNKDKAFTLVLYDTLIIHTKCYLPSYIGANFLFVFRYYWLSTASIYFHGSNLLPKIKTYG